MLKSITFGTFYFFLAFCVILFFWVLFAVPETRGKHIAFTLAKKVQLTWIGVPIEEMDKLFGGNAGDEDLRRIAHIQQRLGFEDRGAATLEKADILDVRGAATCVEVRSDAS